MWGVNSNYAKNVNFTTLKNGALNCRAPRGILTAFTPASSVDTDDQLGYLNHNSAGFERDCGLVTWLG